MTLLLDGEHVRGKNLKVTANLRIEADDLSGQSSNSASAHKGFKPKTLTCSMMVPYTASTHLRSLLRLAEATTQGGELKQYRIVNDTAEAFGVRQVKFSDGVSAREDDSLRAWMVQFTLTEHLSVAERVESRRPDGDATASTGGASETEPGRELTAFERILKRVDETLA
ncbi:baseplate complex protein [Pseudomonas sp. B392_1p]|uniref:baseplate complex protein n=1 Tax=Pseudomonas sp. B392_1p TaxID=3457507 RepID=UPI003FD573DD